MTSMDRARRGVRMVAVAALGMGLAACGGSGGAETAAQDGVERDETVTFTGEPVKVMTMAPVDNEFIDGSAMLAVAEGAVTGINNAGGIAGRELVLVTCDEKFDANEAARCARDAVKEGVNAVVGGFSLNAGTILPILAEAGIPWIGTPLVSQIELTHASSFPVASGAMSMVALGRRAAEDGCTATHSVATQTGDAGSDDLAALVDTGLSGAGAEPATLVRVPTLVSDFSGIALQLEDADCIVVSAPPQVVTGVVAANASLGATPRYYIFGGAITDDVIAPLGSALDGAVTTSNFPVSSAEVWDGPKSIVGDLADDPNGGWSGVFNQNTWVAYQVLADVLAEDAGRSGKDVTRTLETTGEVTTDFTAPFSFDEEFPVEALSRVFNRQVQYVTVEDATIVPGAEGLDLGAALQES